MKKTDWRSVLFFLACVAFGFLLPFGLIWCINTIFLTSFVVTGKSWFATWFLIVFVGILTNRDRGR